MGKCTRYPSDSLASVGWWHSNRLKANESELQHTWGDQHYSIGEYTFRYRLFLIRLMYITLSIEHSIPICAISLWLD